MATEEYAVIAEKFVEFYYSTFDTNREQLVNLYRPDSMLTFETSAVKGAQAIVEKLTNLPFSKIRHEISTLDSQPTPAGTGGILVVVTGRLLAEEEERPMAYTQSFHLVKDANWFVFNDIFRLVYAAAG